ncbi:hypothetical protein BC941DRAFT_442673 [Chlamydoabsidia padenii]|nr:hypothetical protein BC941DRAFT_442673 [Chlamydoabsidia padenii]
MDQQQSSYQYSTSKTTSTWNSDDNIMRTTTTQSHGGSQVLHINAIGANFEKDGQKIGTQDPFFQFTVNLEDKESFQKTFTHNNGGKTPSWNQSFTVPLMGEPDLFVEVLDEEHTAPALIGFAALPINQVVHAPGAALNGVFDLYDVKNKVVGTLHLVLQAQGFQNSSNQQVPSQPMRGQSYVNEIHQKRAKSIRNKEHASDAAGAILGGAMAVGAGLFGKKYFDGQKKEEEEERERQEEEERRRQEYTQREEELKRRETEFSEREEQERRQQQHQDQQGSHHHQKGSHHHQQKKEHCDDRHGHKSAHEWDPVGTYSAGDRVEYHGRTYLCLQGHTSNPTWEPTVAASLWRPA